MKHIRTILGAAAVTTAAVGAVVTTPPPAQAYTCLDQPLTIGGTTRSVKVADDGDGDQNVYFKAWQTGKGRRCTGGVDIFGSSDIKIQWGACSAVNGAWVTPYSVAGFTSKKYRLECGQYLHIDLHNKRLARGAGDRTGGAKVTIDNRWPADNVTIYLPGRTQG